MDTLERVIGQKSRELVSELRKRPAFTVGGAERFVAEAGSDLVESYRWQAENLDRRNLSARSNVQNLLRGIRANGIASRLGLSAAEVWDGLRAFVPLVLQMAESGNPVRFDDETVAERGGRPGWPSNGPARRRAPRTRHEPGQYMVFPGRHAPPEPPAA